MSEIRRQNMHPCNEGISIQRLLKNSAQHSAFQTKKNNAYRRGGARSADARRHGARHVGEY